MIFTPGTRPDLFPKALGSGADIVCIDLEDAVAPRQKDEARAKTLPLFQTPPADDGIERMVRINSLRSPEGLADLSAIIASDSPPPAIMMPKVQSPDEMRIVDELLTGPCAAIRFHVIIETNDGLAAAYEIAQSCDRIDSLLFGAVDMAAELRTDLAWETLLYARSRLVHAAFGAGIDLIDVPHLDLGDTAGLESAAAASSQLGFTGKAAIHPKQIGPINRAFTPGEATVERARRIIAEFDRSDDGLVVLDGTLLEKPVLRSMYRIVAIADRTSRQEKSD